MRYGITYIIVALLLGSCLFSCKTFRNSQKSETLYGISEKYESSRDSTQSEHRSFEQRNVLTDASDEYYLRITEYDVTGAIQRISEKWGNRQLSNLDSQNRHQESVSVTGSESIIINTDSTHLAIEEKEDTSADSRPVQGGEWFWVIIAGALVVAIVIFIIINKIKKWPL